VPSQLSFAHSRSGYDLPAIRPLALADNSPFFILFIACSLQITPLERFVSVFPTEALCL
jgi:hypothetical protein